MKLTDDKETPAPTGAAFDPSALVSGAMAGGIGNIEKEAEKAVDGAIQQVSWSEEQLIASCMGYDRNCEPANDNNHSYFLTSLPNQLMV